MSNKGPNGKTCTKCGEWKSRKEMPERWVTIDKMGPWCKKCTSEQSRSRREIKKSKGICISCGTREIMPGKSVCQICSDGGKLRKNVARSKGICVKCLTRKASPGRVSCQRCLDKDKRRPLRDSTLTKEETRKRTKIRKLEGKCTRCGKEIDKGQNIIHCESCSTIMKMRCGIIKCLLSNSQSKNGESWTSFVDFTLRSFLSHINYWKSVQGLKDSPVEIHHIRYVSEIKWKVPMDKNWKILWGKSNLIPLTRKDHDRVHAGDYSSLHPEVKSYIERKRGLK